MSGYIGPAPVPQATQTREAFTATSGQTTFNTGGYTAGYIDVFLNGVKLAAADYTATNGSDVVLATGAATGDILETVAYTAFTVADQDFTGDLTVDGSTFVIDSTNNRVGIGTSSPATKVDVDNGTSNSLLTLTTNSFDGTARTGVNFQVNGFTNTPSGQIALVGDNNYSGNMVFSVALPGTTNPLTERMRIASDGSVAIGDTNSTRHTQVTKTLIYNGSATASHAALHCGRGGTGTEFQIAFSNAFGVRGTITTDASTVSYNTTSDYRLKENVTDVTDGITRVKQLAPKRFNFIVDPNTTVDGFLAHEAQAVVPEAVTGTHNEVDDDGNAVMQGIDQSKLVPLLTAALQEAIAKIEALEARVTALES
jgi:hypothetical protein